MSSLNFQNSQSLSIGAELELQIINPKNQDLYPAAKNIVRNLNDEHYQNQVKPEITQSMIEINTSVHASPKKLYEELLDITAYLSYTGEKLGVQFCGGGTHPFQQWKKRRIFPTLRFKSFSRKYSYLAKRFTVFGMHIHIGCSSGDEALYLTHALSRYIPHFIALSASSPFYEGIDTGFNSSRLNIVNAFPLSGYMPLLTEWESFSDYFLQMQEVEIIKSMKDFYWDIRPKPEFGAVEIRICDTPLTIQHAACIIAYAQAIAHFLLATKSFIITKDLYYYYAHNKFQACRFGFDGKIVVPHTIQNYSIQEDILKTLQIIKPYARKFDAIHFLTKIEALVKDKKNDATWLRANLPSTLNPFNKIVQRQCQLWNRYISLPCVDEM